MPFGISHLCFSKGIISFMLGSLGNIRFCLSLLAFFFINFYMYIPDLKEIVNTHQLSMAQVNAWLVQYHDLHDRACIELELSKKDTVHLPNCAEIRSLPFASENPDYLKFISVFEELAKLSDYHKYEAYFSSELASYYKIAKAPDQVQKWLRKNLLLGTDKFLLFAAEYTDYEGNEEFGKDACPLSLYFMFMPEANVFINRKDFVHTFAFIEIFYQRFYVDKLLPDTLERLQAAIS